MGGEQSYIETVGTYLIRTAVGNFEIGQKEVRNPASCEPAIKRNTTAFAFSASATCKGDQRCEVLISADNHTFSSVKKLSSQVELKSESSVSTFEDQQPVTQCGEKPTDLGQNK
jgi:hypothetical protein